MPSARYETAAKRFSSLEWWKHLRPANKRLANKTVRRMDAALIAEEDGPLAEGVLFCACCETGFCKEVCCNPDWSDPRDDEYGGMDWSWTDDGYDRAGEQPRWARSAILEENGMGLS